jgi:hypothetical protein
VYVFCAIGGSKIGAMGLGSMYVEKGRRDEEPNTRRVTAALSAGRQPSSSKGWKCCKDLKDESS